MLDLLPTLDRTREVSRISLRVSPKPALGPFLEEQEKPESVRESFDCGSRPSLHKQPRLTLNGLWCGQFSIGQTIEHICEAHAKLMVAVRFKGAVFGGLIFKKQLKAVSVFSG